jgi:hypothetical protein
MSVVVLAAGIWLGLLFGFVCLLAAAGRADRALERAHRPSHPRVPSRPRLRVLRGGPQVSTSSSSSSGKPTALAGRSSRSPL